MMTFLMRSCCGLLARTLCFAAVLGVAACGLKGPLERPVSGPGGEVQKESPKRTLF